MLAGHPIATVAGIMLVLGAGVGLAMSLGDLLLIITAGGPTLAAAGAGARGPTMPVPCMDRLLSDFSAVVTGAWGLDLAGQSVGSRWDLANRSIHGIAPVTPIIAM